MIAVGYVVRRLRWLTAEADTSLLKLILNVLFPAFVLHHLLGETGGLGSTFLLAASAGVACVLGGMGVAFLVAGWIGLRESPRRTFSLSAGLQNYGYIPLPILIALFAKETVAVQLLFTVGIEAALWTAGVMMVTGGRSGAWRNLVNGPFLTTLACLSINALQPEARLPAFVGGAVGALSACAVPLALLLIGATIHDLFRASSDRGESGRPAPEIVAAVVVRLAILPAAILCAAKFLPLPAELAQVLVIQAAMPGAVFPILLARRYGGDPGTAVRVAVSTTLVSVLTIPQVIAFGLWWTGAAG